MRIGILGSGNVAKSLSRGFVARGDEVRLGTRTGSKAQLAAWIAEQHLAIAQGTLEGVTGWAEAIVLAMRGMANPETVRAAGEPAFRGKVVIDATNPLVWRADGFPSLGLPEPESAGARLQKDLPGAKVVKAFNTIGHAHMVRPQFANPPTMFICGDDPTAKTWVTELLRDFGWSSIVDVGGIERSRLLESLCVLWITCGMRLENWNIAMRLEQRI